MPPLVISSCILGFLALCSPGLWIIAAMMADAPGADKLLSVRLVLGAAMSFPVVVVGALIVAWILFALGQPQLGFYVSLAPLVNLLVGFVGFCLFPQHTL